MALTVLAAPYVLRVIGGATAMLNVARLGQVTRLAYIRKLRELGGQAPSSVPKP